jgi:hypothetical protein
MSGVSSQQLPFLGLLILVGQVARFRLEFVFCVASARGRVFDYFFILDVEEVVTNDPTT